MEGVSRQKEGRQKEREKQKRKVENENELKEIWEIRIGGEESAEGKDRRKVGNE